MSLGISGAIWGAVAGAGISAVANHGVNKAAANAQNAAADATRQQGEIAKEQYDDWKKDFLPIQGQMAERAKTIGGVEDQAKAADLAAGDVGIAYGRAKNDLTDRLTSFGVDPSSSKYATTYGRFGLGEAAASAGAQNKARTDAINKGDAFRMDFYNAGKGTPSSAMAGLGASAAANTNAANAYSNTASRNSMGIGSFVQKLAPSISNWWSNSTSPSVNNPNAEGVPGYGLETVGP